MIHIVFSIYIGKSFMLVELATTRDLRLDDV